MALTARAADDTTPAPVRADTAAVRTRRGVNGPGLTYVRTEVRRSFRSGRALVFSLAFPLILFFTVAGSNRHGTLGGIPFPVYYMSGMAAWGTMGALIATGGRIAGERSVGWNRQLRTTPLSPRTYIAAKVVTGYALALVSLAALYLAGLSLGVRLPLDRWLEMTGLILVGLIPFAALGILIGHFLTVDSIGPALGGLTSLFALLGGAWGPIGQHGALHRAIQCLPSYWLVQAGRVADGAGRWPAQAWIVVAVWTFVLARLAVRAWQRDTKRA
jgi:ABC-2 type transport system permease protein